MPPRQAKKVAAAPAARPTRKRGGTILQAPEPPVVRPATRKRGGTILQAPELPVAKKPRIDGNYIKPLSSDKPSVVVNDDAVLKQAPVAQKSEETKHDSDSSESAAETDSDEEGKVSTDVQVSRFFLQVELSLTNEISFLALRQLETD